jgi:RNA polymerase sigma factor (sigma-70 family)
MNRVPLAGILRQVRGLAATCQLQEISDGQLLARFTAGRDEAAFAALVERHGGMVLGVARRILHDLHAAEDVFQTTFLTLARDARSVRRRDAVGGWLYGVAARLARQARLQAARRVVRERAHIRLAVPTDVTAALTWQELGTALDEELERLPERYRAPLVLVYFEAKTQDAAAHQLGWSKGTLRRRLERGRRLLHTRLLRRGVALSLGLMAGGLSQLAAQSAVSPVLARQTIHQALHVTGAGLLGRAKALQGLLLTLGLLAAGAGMTAHQLAAGRVADESSKPVERGAQRLRNDHVGELLPEGAIARLGTVRLRHGHGCDVVFSSDGKTLLTASGTRTLRTWDVASGRLLREQRLPKGPSCPVATLSPDGRYLALQQDPQSVALWDVSGNRLLHSLSLGAGDWGVTLFSPDSRTLVTCQQGGELRAWDVATGNGRQLCPVNWQMYSLAFTADGSLMTAGPDWSVCFWDVGTGRERSRIVLLEPVQGATPSPDGKVVATWVGGEARVEKGLKFWEARNGMPAAGWIAPRVKAVRSAQFSPDGKTVFVGTRDGTLVWDPIAGKPVRTLQGASANQVRFSPDGKNAATLGGQIGSNFCLESVVHFWDLATGALHPASLQGHLGTVDGIAFAADGRTVASSCGHDREVRIWDAANGRQLHTLSVKDEVVANTLTFTPDGKHLVTGTKSGVVVWDVATGRELRRTTLVEKPANPHTLLISQMSDDGRTWLALGMDESGMGGCSLHAWEMSTLRRLRSVTLPWDQPWYQYTGRFSPDGKTLVLPTGGIHDAATGRELSHLHAVGHSSLQAPVAFSADGALVALAMMKEGPHDVFSAARVAVGVWELATLRHVVCLETGIVGHIAFTPDGRRLVSGGPDGLQLWDLASGRAVLRRQVGVPGGSFDFIGSLALTVDGKHAGTGNTDTTVLLWDLLSPITGRPVVPLTAAQQEGCWEDLAAVDAARAMAALARLAEVPEQAVRLVRGRLLPAAFPPEAELRRLLVELNDDRFERRKAAAKRLAEMGDVVDTALRAELRRQPSLEARRSIKELLAEPRLATCRHLRVIRLLESLGPAGARQLLEELATGIPEASLTRAARAAVERLIRRSTRGR